MSFGVSRAFVTAACLVWLAGCESASKSGLFGMVDSTGSPDASTPSDTTATTQSDTVAAPQPETTAATPSDTTASTTPAPTALPSPRAFSQVTGAVLATPQQRPVFGRLPSGPQAAAEDPNDALALGKRQFREGNYGVAEMHFRRVVENERVPAPRKAEAWLGLAASYDRLKRFDLADRAYAAALAILGPTPELLNNQGFSYMLRGDYPRARAKLGEALDKDPTNPYIQNNIEVLEKSMRGGGRKKV